MNLVGCKGIRVYELSLKGLNSVITKRQSKNFDIHDDSLQNVIVQSCIYEILLLSH